MVTRNKSADISTSIIFFANESLRHDSVSLGDLVLDVDAPWDNYCPEAGFVSEEGLRVASQPRLYSIIEQGLANGAGLDIGFIKRMKAKGFDDS